jgi:hypothetical protein
MVNKSFFAASWEYEINHTFTALTASAIQPAFRIGSAAAAPIEARTSSVSASCGNGPFRPSGVKSQPRKHCGSTSMTKSQNPVRRRKPPTQLILSEEFKRHMEALMKSEERQHALNEFAGHHCRPGIRANAAGLARRSRFPRGQENPRGDLARHCQRLLQIRLRLYAAQVIVTYCYTR